jgi:hypothetical protein
MRDGIFMALIAQGPVIQTLAAAMAVLATAAAFVSLVILHLVSPEFNPSWRMVSAYADGRHGWLLSIMFAAWGLGSLSRRLSGPGDTRMDGTVRTPPPGFGRDRRGDGSVLRQESQTARASGDVRYPESAHRSSITYDNVATIGRTARTSGVDDAPHVDQLFAHGRGDDALHALVVEGRRRALRANSAGGHVACQHHAVRRLGKPSSCRRLHALGSLCCALDPAALVAPVKPGAVAKGLTAIPLASHPVAPQHGAVWRKPPKTRLVVHFCAKPWF